MDFEKDLFDQFDYESDEELYGKLRPECIIVDKVYDSCFQRECEPSKVVALPGAGPYRYGNIVFGPGFIVDGTLEIIPIRMNFARIKFLFRVPFTLTVKDTDNTLSIDDYVEFSKDIEVYLPQAPSEFTFDIVLETRSQLLKYDIVGNQAKLSIGTFAVIRVVGRIQLMVQAYGYCPQPRECIAYVEEDVSSAFEKAPFPEFFPPRLDDHDTADA